MGADFSGIATKAGLKCSDGRTIMPEAFAHQDGMRVPLVWQHMHDDPKNILGHAFLRKEGSDIRADAFFNDSESAKQAKMLVEHGDVVSLSIYANQLVEKSKQVFHGVIREVSLVLSGANPGALIDSIRIAHSDGTTDVLDDEAIIYTGLTIEHSDDEEDDDLSHADGQTIQDVYDSLSEEQKDVVHYLIGAAVEAAGGSIQQSDNPEGNEMKHNVFENGAGSTAEQHVLSHDDVKGIVADAIKGGSLKEAVQDYALKHGIDNIDILFPDAKAVTDRPEFDKRRTEWVADVINGTRHSPFSRIKSLTADLTHEEARAKGYIKGNMKKEEFFGVSKRVTTPTTVYKKQKLDRDDIIDITDFDVVAWLKAEMRLMLDEELARAVLIGDGREVDDEDKIKDPMGASEGAGIRSIANDHELYTAKVYVNLDDYNPADAFLGANSATMSEVVDAIVASRTLYKGSGNPTFYTTEKYLTQMLMVKDGMRRRMYRTVDELATELRVSRIIPVEAMEDVPDLVGVIVNLDDYTLGADKGGDVAMFDDFDIDYNQYKYLIETRLSGALTKIRSAIAVWKTAGTNVLAEPVKPSFNKNTNTITIPTTTGVDYKIDNVTKTGTVVITEDTLVQAVPKSGYYFATSEDSWVYDFQSA